MSSDGAIGRPSAYTEEMAERLCILIAEGKSLRAISMLPDMPTESMIYRWLAKYTDFREQYARAREQQMECMAQEALLIADEVLGDPNRDRLRVDTRKWLMSKLAPKKYGDKADLTVKGNITYVVDTGVKRAGE